MTKERYMALADFQSLWTNKIKPFIGDTYATQDDLDEVTDAIGYSAEFIDLGLPSGTLWAKMNIGAAEETGYGLSFQWGDAQGYTADQVGSGEGKKYFGWADYKYSSNGGSTASDMTKYNSSDGLTTLQASDDAAAANIGSPWRMPTETDFNELLNAANCTKAWTSDYNGTGIKGYLFTSVRNGNTLFFPAAGYCNDGSVYNVGIGGGYWSSSLITSLVQGSRYLSFLSGYIGMSNDYRKVGFSVRPVCDSAPLNKMSDKADKKDTYTKTESDTKYATKTELAALEASSIKPGTKFTSSSGTQYTAGQILTAMADLMDKAVVVHE